MKNKIAISPVMATLEETRNWEIVKVAESILLNIASLFHMTAIARSDSYCEIIVKRI